MNETQPYKIPSEQQKKALQLKQQRQIKKGQLVCSIMMASLGLISNSFLMIACPKILTFCFDKDRYPADFIAPSLMTYIGLCSGYLFVLVLNTVFLRWFTRKGAPAEAKDPASIQSINQLIKNALVYHIGFLMIYMYVKKHWDKEQFYVDIYPFVLWAAVGLEYIFRCIQFITGVKGVRYLAHPIIGFLFLMLVVEIF